MNESSPDRRTVRAAFGSSDASFERPAPTDRNGEPNSPAHGVNTTFPEACQNDPSVAACEFSLVADVPPAASSPSHRLYCQPPRAP